MKKFKQLLFLSCSLLIYTTVHADLVLDKVSFITQDHPAVVGENQPDSRFGHSLSSSDNILYISSLDYTYVDDIPSGAVHKLVGTADSLLVNHPHNKLIHNGHITNDLPDPVENFGYVMVTAKTQGDEEQLIISVPDKDVDGVNRAGVIHYIDSICDDCNDTDLTSTSFHQNIPGIIGGAEPLDRFGRALAAGDFNGDGYEDIAIGIYFEDIGSIIRAGAVQIIMSAGANGLTANNNQFWSQNSTGVLDVAEADDLFGFSLASGDFNGDGVDDLAIGVVSEADVGSSNRGGSVQVLYGVRESDIGIYDNGLSAVGNQIWNQNSPGIAGVTEAGDSFGHSLATGDFNGDGVDDLAIGIPGEGIEGENAAGAVQILYGLINVGLIAEDSLLISQYEPGFVGASEGGDVFGHSLAVGDLNADGIDDLAIGAYGEDIGEIWNTGAVYVVHGSNDGLQFSDEYTITEGNLGGTQGLTYRAGFGYALTINDFDGDGKDDLAVSRNPYPFPDSIQAVSVIYQQQYQDLIFADGFGN